MARAKRKKQQEETPQMELDDIFDEILDAPQAELEERTLDGAEDEEEEPEADIGEEEESASTEEDDDNTPVVKLLPDSDREEAEGSESDGADDDQESESDDSPSADSPALTGREQGLLREMASLRQKNQELTLQHQQPVMQAPQAPLPQETTAPDPMLGRVPLIVSEDGQHVYNDDAALDARIEQRAQALIDRAAQPTEDQVRVFKVRQMTDAYVAEDPDMRGPAAVLVHQADEYISQHLTALISAGHKFRDAAHAAETLRELGIDKQIGEYFPTIEPMLDEFVEGVSSGSPRWRRTILEKLTSAGGSSAGESAVPNPDLKVKLGRVPQSMTKKGGTRSQTTSADDKEFNHLEEGFRDNILGYPQDKYDRLQELGKSLGKPGYEG